MAGLIDRISEGPIPRHRPEKPSVCRISAAVPTMPLRCDGSAVCMRVLITVMGSVATELSEAACTPSVSCAPWAFKRSSRARL